MARQTSIPPALIGIPYEEGTYFRKGAKEGPAAVFAHLERMREIGVTTEKQLPFAMKEIITGSVDINPYDKDHAFVMIEEAVRQQLRERRAPISIGGDHSVTIPILRALKTHAPTRRIGIIHIDAHSDTFPPVGDYAYHHGAVFKVAVEEGLVAPADIVQFGLRGQVRIGGFDFLHRHPIRTVNMDAWRDAHCQIAPYVPEGPELYYASIDIDAVDPAYAPGTGTPVPGGMTSAEILQVARQIGRYPLVGADLVEVAPVYDPSHITSLLAAHILFELLSHASFYP